MSGKGGGDSFEIEITTFCIFQKLILKVARGAGTRLRLKLGITKMNELIEQDVARGAGTRLRLKSIQTLPYTQLPPMWQGGRGLV